MTSTTATPPPPPKGSARLGSPSPVAQLGDATVVVSNVSCMFASLVAVSDVSFLIGPGVTALLGPNGAGKSTLLRLMTGCEIPSAGTVRVLGGDPRQSARTRRQIGLVPQQDGVFDAESALNFVALAATLQGVKDPIEAARSALARVDLSDVERRQIGQFSKGMRQRVKIAQAIVADPAVVFLDEPLNGLDPRQRRETISLFTDLADEGKTVVVSSHVLEEVERFGSRILVIVEGRLGAEGDYHEIRRLMEDQLLRFEIEANDPHRLGASLLAAGVVESASVQSPGRIEVSTSNATELRMVIATFAHQLGVRLYGFRPLDDDLESVFRYLVAKR